MIHRFSLCLLALFLGAAPAGALESIPEKTTQLPTGEIVFPVSDTTAGPNNSLTWKYKPTRWGMYDIELVYANDVTPGQTTLQIGDKSFTAAGHVTRQLAPGTLSHVTRYYLEKSAPFEITLDSKPAGLQAVLFRPAPEGKPIVQHSDAITLHASNAITHSIMMRYEPQPNKNCLGYWTNPDDSASWTFQVTKPGIYEVELWQGCGKGHGGSAVMVTIHEPPFSSKLGPIKKTRFVVQETGHFQNFVPRHLGQVTLDHPGEHELLVQPLNKKAAAVMDIRQIVLKQVPAGASVKNPGLESALSGQRVVFLGDSITYGGEYIELLETWIRLRYPTAPVDFINLGLPSETLSGLSEPGHAGGQFPRPDLHERLDRVLEKATPDIIFACYGMNDGIYHPFSPNRLAAFERGLYHLRATAARAGAILIHVTPPTFDPVPIKDRTLPAGRDEYRSPFTGYNEVLDQYSDGLLKNRHNGWEVIDIHTPMNQFLAEQRQTNPRFLLAADGVHANAQGHWLIAREILRYLGAPDDLTSSPTADALLKSSPRAPGLHKLVQQRQRLLKDAWLTHVGHKRPGMSKGKPLDEAQREAAELEETMRSL